MDDYPKPVNNQQLTKILDQMNKSLYKVNEKERMFETGFFCYVKIKEKLKEKNIPVLIINKIVRLEEYKDEVNISINKKTKNIKLGDTKYQNEEYNMTIIEIKENKRDKIQFLEIDDAIYEENSEMYYDKKPIYIIQWKNMKDLNNSSLSYGVIKEMNKNEFKYSSEMKTNPKISLIFNSSNNKLIGKHETNLPKYKQGKFFGILINKFINKYNADNKYEKLPNKINISIKVDEDDINKQIYFLDNYAYKNEHFHDNLRELNEINTKLYINDKRIKFQKFFVPKEIKEFNVYLEFDINLTDSSYMFAGCTKISDIKFISFNTKHIKNMKFMFHGCENIKTINLFSFNIKNVIDMSDMFSYCESLTDLNLSHFDFENIKNISNMFYNCYNLKNLNLPPLNDKNDIDMDHIFHGCNCLNNFDISKYNSYKKDIIKENSICVYFIENHINTCSPSISLSGDSGGLFSELKKEKEAIYSKPGKNEKFLYTIYSFDIYPKKIYDRGKNTLNIRLILVNENEKFYHEMTFTDFGRTTYIYDLEFKPKGIIKKINPPKSYKFSRSIQFEIYREYLEKDLGMKKKTDKKREDLVFFTQKLFKEKFMFNFYIIIFIESLFTNNFINHFNYFYPENIEGKGELGKYQSLSKNFINIVRKKPEKFLTNFKYEREKEQIGIKLFAFISYFYYEYFPHEFPESLQNDDKNAKFYINNALVNYSFLFLKVKLSKEKVQELIKVSKTYTQLSNALQYLDKLSDILDMVESNFKKFKDFYKNEKEHKPKIDLDLITFPRKEDDMKYICEKYKNLVKMQRNEMNDISIFISGSLFEKYIAVFEGINVDNLFFIKDVVKSEKIDLNKDLDKSIYETGLILSKNGKMTNLEILDFIKKLINEKQLNKLLEIIPQLNIQLFDKKFYEEWKNMNWSKILENKEDLKEIFIDKIFELISKLKDFDILFNLLKISIEPDDKEIRLFTLEKIQKKLIKLYIVFDFNDDKDLNIKNIIMSLIEYSKNEKKEAEKVVEFLKIIQDILSEAKINEIYTFLLSQKEENLNEVIIKYIITFYTTKKEMNAEFFLEIFKKCNEKIKIQFLDNINNVIPNERDFLEVENGEKYKLFKGLLNIDIFKNEKFKSIYYIEIAYSVILNIQRKLTSGEIEWRKISSFYIQEKNNEEKKDREESLKDKLLSIFLNDKNKADKIKAELDEYDKTKKNKINSLNLILDDFLEFLSETQKNNIIELKKLIKILSSGPINSYSTNKEKIETLINLFEKSSKIRAEKNKSFFYRYIYRNNKKKFKKDKEQNWIDKTEKNFKQLKIILNGDGIQALNKNDKGLLKICLEAIKDKKKEEISNEIEIIIKLFEVNISDAQKDKIIDSLVVLSKKEDVIEISKAISLFINKLDLSKDDLWFLVNDIIKKSEDLYNDKLLNIYINNLKKYDVDIDLLYEPDNYLNILLILKKNPDSISFLIGKNQQVCKILEEAAFYNDNVLLNINNIKDFEECVKFINKLGYEGNFKQMDSVKFFKSLQREVKKNKDIILFIKKYINDYEELKNLFETKFDKSASSNYIINAISNESKFILKNEKGHFFNGIYKIKAEKYGEMKQIKIAKLKELRERALLTNILYNVPEEIENQKTFKEFIEKVNIICKIYDLIKEIYSSGYFKEIKIVIENKYNKTYYTIWNTVTSYPEEVFNKIENELNDFSKKKKAAYRDMPLIRYIYGRQLKLIYDKIYEKKNNDIYPLLIFISNNSGINKYNIEYNIDEEKDIFFNINNYINEIFRTNRKNLDNIMSLDTIRKKDGESEFCGIYTFQADRINNTLQKSIVLIYKYLTDKKPKAQYILLCNEETSIEELTSFLYRAILCHFKSCFIIAGIEFLKLNQRMAFQILLDELYKKNEERMKSCLIIAYEDNDADIIKGLFSLKNRKSLRNVIKKIENQNIYNFDSKVEIVFSDNVGVGKSAYIRSEIEEKRKREYIYFPFGGELTKEEILKRLKELKKMKNLNRASLHLDLYDTDQIELTNEFLFSILINKIYGQNDDIFYLPSDFEIMVEIPNGYADFMKKFPILEIFKKTFLGIENLLPLKVKSVLDTNVQIVANYLKFLKNDINCLNTRDIYFEGINPNFKEFETKIVAEILPQKECQELIFKKIEEKIPKPNYYQITSFINILGTQLRKFSQNFILSAMNLNNSGQNDIRSFVVKNFIEFAIDLESGYIDLIKNQMRNYRKFIRNFNEDKKYEEAILKLANADEKKNIISFDNMKRTLLIFSEGNGEGFSIISNLKDKEEINKYSSVMAIGGSSKIPMLNNNVNQKIFLEQLKVILNVNNKIGSYDDYDYDEEQKSKNIIEKRESQLNKKKEK